MRTPYRKLPRWMRLLRRFRWLVIDHWDWAAAIAALVMVVAANIWWIRLVQP